MGRVVLDARDYEPKPIVGYADQVSVEAGDDLTFYVSCDGADSYDVSMVRLIHGDLHSAGPGFKEQKMAEGAFFGLPGFAQETQIGSCSASCEPLSVDWTKGLSLWLLACPTKPKAGHDQTIMSQEAAEGGCQWRLFLDDGGHVVFEAAAGTQRVRLATPMLTRIWYALAAVLDPVSGTVSVVQQPVIEPFNGRLAFRHPDIDMGARGVAPMTGLPSDRGRVLVGAAFSHIDDRGRVRFGDVFNGKIDRPRITSGVIPVEGDLEPLFSRRLPGGTVLAWDFHAGITTAGVSEHRRVVDVSGSGHHGELINMPARAMTGYNWNGSEFDYRHASDQYGAIHFHDDDLIDCDWTESFTVTIPGSWPSGVYAAKLRADIDGVLEEDYVVFFVRPGLAATPAKILLVMPTASYLAYGNDLMATDSANVEVRTGSVPHLQEQELARNRHREYGVSLYDHHSDGSGVCYSSWMRPLLTVRPKYRHSMSRVWQFNADLHLLDWFDAKGYDIDVATDHDVHEFGSELLDNYRVVVTPSHSEYTSGRMLDVFHSYVAHGGRLMYLGGNGFYWTTAFWPEDPRVIEVRRWGGIEAWTAMPGEYYLSTTGELGGLWRNKGRAPQKLTGVGFVAQGLDLSTYYVRNEDSFTDSGSWIMAGIPDDARIGEYGLEQGGAAGIEVDWYDPQLGSPGWASVVASSEGLSRLMIEVRENHGQASAFMGGDMNPKVRSDVVYFRVPGGGAVFSTGSIAWCGSLSYNNYDNYPSKIMTNVVERFSNDDALP